MAGFPFVCYYVHECNFIKEYWIIMDAIIHSEEENRYELDNLDTLVQDHEEILIFIDDLLNLKQPGVPARFTDAFVNECLSPLVRALDSETHSSFSIKIILFILSVLFKNITNPLLVDTLALVAFGKYYTRPLMDCLYEPVDRLLSYDKKWKFKGFWDTYEDRVMQYCVEHYHSSSENRLPEPSLMESISRRIDTLSVFGVTNNFYEREIEKVETIFGIPIISTREELRRPSNRVANQAEA